ncbi:MAG: phosphate regulon sensor histidine kinase PhoR [Pseudohongiellaceae bacterium]
MNYWRFELIKILILIAIAVAAGYFFENFLVFLLLALAINFAINLYEVSRLEFWLSKKNTENPLPTEQLGKFWSSIAKKAFQESNKSGDITTSPISFRNKTKNSLIVKKKVFAQAGTGTLMINEHDDVVWCNSEIEALLEFSYSELSSKNINNIIKDKRFSDYLDSQKYNRPLRSIAPNSDNKVFEYQAIVFSEEDRLIIVRDITQLDRLESMRKDFVGNLSHELRTPITVIQGYSEALLDNLDDVDAKWKKPLKQMHQSAIRMKNLIKDLLLLSSLETETPTGQRDDVHLHALLHEITGDTQQVFTKKDHNYSIDCETNIYITGDRSELYSAFSNLLSNAAKYTPKGGKIDIRTAASQAFFDIEIIDDGIGIDRQHIPRLTERFYRVSESRTTDTGGTGLGLAIVKHILARHDGELKIHSLIGLGSRFVCRLPKSRVAESEKPFKQNFNEAREDKNLSQNNTAL